MSGRESPKSDANAGGATERSGNGLYSSVNKERLERIENELREKK